MATQVDFDAAVLGGGPGGSSAAAYLARAGMRVVVFEREKFPREHVGESLVPSSTRVFAELGFLEKMKSSGFPVKYGAVWTTTERGPQYFHTWEGLKPEEHADIEFREREQPGVPLEHTWHVDRGRFDQMLLEHARECGATVHESARVESVDFSDPTRPVVRAVIDGETREVKVGVVVDATGRRTLLGNQLRVRIRDDVFDQFALHTWFEDFDRSRVASRDGQDEYIFIHFLPLTNSWIWQIPITDRITSVGVVTQRANFAKSKVDREKFFWDCVGSRPELLAALKASKQLRPLKEEGDYSYAMTQICGDGWVMVGDAARFVDPIFSTGVSIALNGSRFATRDIIAAWQEGRPYTREAFASYEATMKRGTDNWYQFITVYYRLNLLFTAFIQDPRFRLDVLKLLQGDVYEEQEPEVLARMRSIVSEVESNPEHLWHKYLGSLTADAFKPRFSATAK
jgi:flavin-dependent dehydrogenase